MIRVKEFPNQTFESKEDLFKALRESKSELIATKKMQTKEADSVIHIVSCVGEKGVSIKNDPDTIEQIKEISAVLVINTTNIMDSHSDVHFKGLWNKSVKEQKGLYLLQEHRMTFDHIISDSVKASVKEMSWKELGYNYEGTTEALIFDALISKKRNEFMFKQYANGYVKEHSVGMRYVKYELAINSESKYDKEEKEVWDKYINQIVNKAEAEEQGYFWAVTEAKIIEGSAVVKGSNHATPTISIEAVSDTSKIEPSNDTHEVINYIKTKNYFN